jgi:hypothetical protein
MKFFTLVLFLSVTALAEPSPAPSLSPFMSVDKIKEMNASKKKSVAKRKKVIYAPLDQVIPVQKQKKLKKKPIPQKEEHSFLDFLFPKAYAFGGKAPTPPAPVVTPEPRPSTPVTGVDLRKYDSSIKSQFGGTCTTFGLLAAMENKIRASRDLSERHFWSKYQAYSSFTAVKTALGSNPWVGSESWWPQTRTSPVLASSAEQTRALKIVSLDQDIEAGVDKLNQGYPLYIAMSVPQELADCREVVRASSAVTNGGHAMAVVGYQLDSSFPGGGYFILKNSWGQSCGDNGYQYLSFGFCQKQNAYCYFWSVEAVETK